MKGGSEVRILGFGTFKVTNRKARQGPQSPDGRGYDAEGRPCFQVPSVQEFEGHAELSRSA